jgi:6-phosphogluconolactonase
METLVIGSRVSDSVEGLNCFLFDERMGMMTYHSGSMKIEQPTFQCFDAERKILYSVSETKTDGHVYAIQVYPDLTCKLLYTIPTGGGSPCHLSLSPDHSMLVVSNYADGVLTIFSVLDTPTLLFQKSFTGKGTHPTRQERSHIHSSRFTKDGSAFFVADLGLDRVLWYQSDMIEKGTIITPPGSGPRHLELSEDEKFLYVASELSSEILVYALAEKPTLIQRISTLEPGYKKENTVADIHFDANHRFLYCSNRGHDSIAIYRCESKNGTLRFIGHCKTEKEPRNFTFSPSGAHLVVANGSSNSITSYPINRRTGLCGLCNHRIIVEQPVCLNFLG